MSEKKIEFQKSEKTLSPVKRGVTDGIETSIYGS